MPKPTSENKFPTIGMTFICGFISIALLATTSALQECSYASFSLNKTDLVRLDNSIRSKSHTKIVPTPNRVRFFITSLPKAPAPTTRTFAFLTLSCLNQERSVKTPSPHSYFFTVCITHFIH